MDTHKFNHRKWRSWLHLSVFLISFFGAFFYARFLYVSESSSSSFSGMAFPKSSNPREALNNLIKTPLNSSKNNGERTSSANTKKQRPRSKSTPSCPDYFRWIHEDLSPWRDTGITLDTVKKAADKADFRLVIVNGKAYGEIFSKSRSIRRNFTLWGIVQLLRRYPGKVPDLDLMFHSGVRPIIKKDLYPGPGEKAPPPLFGYAGSDSTFDIAFPDWSFWGWPSRKLKPWEALSKELKEGNGRRRWSDRDPHAYWKGALSSAARMDLAKCNVSDKHDWNARIYNVPCLSAHPISYVKQHNGIFDHMKDWNQEKKQGFNHSSLTSQCTHRYNIYMEGIGWSAGEKYILACGSVTLRIKPRFYAFFSRNLMPLQHYWPINPDDKCRSIMYAVEWGKVRKEEAESIGKAGSNFIEEEMEMDYVYDYMFHLFKGYAKLLKYRPRVPPKAIQLGWESMAAVEEEGLKKKYMTRSSVRGPSVTKPCSLPPPYDRHVLGSVLERKKKLTKLVESWERQYWDSQQKN